VVVRVTLPFVLLAGLHFAFERVLPFWAMPGSTAYFALSTPAILFTALYLGHYVATIFISPGYAPLEGAVKDAKGDKEADMEALLQLPHGENTPPPRSHYCHFAEKQVLKLYHYDPFVGNTIGFYNFRNYILCIIFATLGSCYLGFLCTAPVWFCDFAEMMEGYVQLSDTLKVQPGMCDGISTIHIFCGVLFLVAVQFSLVVTTLMHCVLNNKTTLELLEKSLAPDCSQYRHVSWVYDLGPAKNLEAVFGKNNPGTVWLPIFMSPPGNGMHFETVHTLLGDHTLLGERSLSSKRTLVDPQLQHHEPGMLS